MERGEVNLRKIQFRGMALVAQDWVYGAYVRFRAVDNQVYDGIIMEDNEEHLMGDIYSIDPDTLGEFSGLCDKNGTKIFEGDILAGPDLSVNGVVKLMYGVWYVTSPGVRRYRYLGRIAERSEVLGNITENPELLVCCKGVMPAI